MRNRLWGQDERTMTQANILCIISGIVAAARYLQMTHQSAAQCPKHTFSKHANTQLPLSTVAPVFLPNTSTHTETRAAHTRDRPRQ